MMTKMLLQGFSSNPLQGQLFGFKGQDCPDKQVLRKPKNMGIKIILQEASLYIQFQRRVSLDGVT